MHSKNEVELSFDARSVNEGFARMAVAAFITELNANSYAVWFIKENGCDQYYRYNKGLLFDERQQAIVQDMDAVETLLNKQGAIS